MKELSQDEVARMAYEAREAEIRDQLTREKVAREEGIEKGNRKRNKKTQFRSYEFTFSGCRH